MLICSSCGHENSDESNFCSNCGARLDHAASAAPAAGTTSGHENTSTITFGGAALAAAAQAADERDAETQPVDEADAAAVDALPQGSALLIVQRGPGAGSRFLLDTDVVTAGRHPDSEIFLDDVTVSRRHAEFRRTPEGYTVTDVGSLNGTYVNRDRIDQVLLQGGDEVQIGKFRLVYFTGQSAGSAAEGAPA